VKAVTVMSTMQLPTQTSVQPWPPSPTPAAGVGSASSQVAPVYDEQIIEIVGRLQRRYPSERISRAELERRVRDVHRQFNTARVRGFVAVFVERLVRRSIDEPTLDAPRTEAARG
jgi:hypothetical protein